MVSAPFNITGANGAPGMPTPPTSMFPGMPTPSTPVGGAGNFNFGNTQNPTAPQSPGAPPISQPAGPGASSTFMPASPPPSLTPGAPGSPVVNSSASSGINSIYGGGVGSLVTNFLDSNGGYNSALTDQVVKAQSAAAQEQTTLGLNNLKENIAASGISPNSSVAALEESNYMAQATTQENAIAAQEYFNMWGESDQLQAGMLSDVAKAGATKKANSGNWWESILGAAVDIGSVVAAPFTGGASLLGLGLGSSLMKGGAGGGGGGGAIPSDYTSGGGGGGGIGDAFPEGGL